LLKISTHSLTSSLLLGIIAASYYINHQLMQSRNTYRRLWESKIMTMCLIYLLAGAFAVVSKAMGGVDAVCLE
jgi:Na+/H+ antiporter NhaC